MYVLMYGVNPIKVSTRFEALNAYIADTGYSAEQQKLMLIVPDVEALE